MHQYWSYKQRLEMRNSILVLLDTWIDRKCLIPQSPYNPPLGQTHPATVIADTPPVRALSGGPLVFPGGCQAGCGQPAATHGLWPVVSPRSAALGVPRGSEMCYTWVPFSWKTSGAHVSCGKMVWKTKQSLIIVVLHPYGHALLPTPGPCTWTATGEFLLFSSA